MFAEIPVREEEGEDTPCLLKAEVETAINRLKNSKSPGVDNVTAEEIQAVGERAIDALFCLCEVIWKSEKNFQGCGKCQRYYHCIRRKMYYVAITIEELA